MLDFKNYIECNTTIDSSGLFLNENCLKYPLHENDEVFGQCTPLFYAILQRERNHAIALLKEGADQLKKELILFTPKAECPITYDSLETLDIENVLRIGKGKVSVDKFFKKIAIEAAVANKEVHPLLNTPLAFLEVQLQPLHFSPQTLAVRLGEVDILEAMQASEDFYKDVLKYALLYNQSKVINWVLKVLKDKLPILTAMANTNLELINFYLGQSEELFLGSEAALLYKFAIEQNKLHVIDALLKKKAPLTEEVVEKIFKVIQGESNEAKLRKVLDKSYFYLCEFILNNVDIRFEPEAGKMDYKFLINAITKKTEELRYLKLFLQHGADPNHKADEFPLLFFAIQAKSFEIVKILVGEHSADINAESESGYNPLVLAIDFGCERIFNYLLANININVRVGLNTIYEPLVYALSEAKFWYAERLWDRYNIDKNYVFTVPFGGLSGGKSLTYYPIHVAIRFGAIEIIHSMLKKGSHWIHYRTGIGLTTWELALSLGLEDIAKLLLEHCDLNQPVDVKFPNEEKMSCLPIHAAFKYQALEVINWMVIERGFDVNQVYMDSGYTVLGYEMQHYSGLEMQNSILALLTVGAKVNEKIQICKNKLPSLKLLKQIFKKSKQRQVLLCKRGESFDAIISPVLPEDFLKTASKFHIYSVPCNYNNHLCTRVLNVDLEIVCAGLDSFHNLKVSAKIK